MKPILFFPTALLALQLASGCNSTDKPAAGATTTPAAAASPAAKADELPALTNSSVDLTPGIELQLPTSRHGDAYLHVVSAKLLKADPLPVQLPALWAAQAGSAKVLPGYRISYEAVLVWQPIKQGPDQQAPTQLAFAAPTGTDSLAAFYAGDQAGSLDTGGYKVTQLAPNTPFTVRGTLYTYRGRTAQQQPALIVYPYEHKGSAPGDAFRQLALPLHQ